MSGTQRVDADVVVVGGGGAGLAAALSAVETGRKTVLLEKNPELGGTTGMSIGSITAAGTRFQKKHGIKDNVDDHFADMSLFLGPLDNRENKDLRRVLVDNVPDTFEWLMGFGLRFFGPMPEPPHRVKRMHNVIPNSRAYPRVLGRACEQLGVDVRTNAPAKKLITGSNGAVEGVLAEVNGVPTEFRARGGVVLTSGDFSNGKAYKEKYLPHAAFIDAINPTNTGDGQAMGEALGGSVVNGDILWGPSLRFVPRAKRTLLQRLPPWPPITWAMQLALENLPLWLFRPFVVSFMTSSLAPEPSLFRAGAILVNTRGERFTDELDKAELKIPLQPDKSCFIVFDDAIAEKFETWPNFVSTAPGVAYAYVSDYRKMRKDIYFRADSIEALARAMGVPGKPLADAIAKRNAEIAANPGKDARVPLLKAPFHALGPMQSWVVLTEGGLKVSTRHEVLDGNDAPITGLFAAGAAGQGGVILAGHGHHLGWAFTSGRRAGKFAAERAPL